MSDCIELQKAFEIIDSYYRHDVICELSPEQIDNYKKKLERFDNANTCSNCSTKEKGDALEDISKYLLEISGGLFEIVRNLHTNTNEIDLLMNLSYERKFLIENNFINKRFNEFIAECKNYDKKISVTYVGKLIGLMETNSINFAIMFSYHGVSGKGWSSSSGLIKKYYLSRGAAEERPCIIDFNYTDFCSILDGSNFFEITEKKINALKYDTDYRNFLNNST